MPEVFDCAVVGAGVFGSWTAYELLRRGRRVVLFDAHGPGNSRASSGGESRIIRMSYGPDEIYTRWSMLSLGRLRELFERTKRPELFQRTGVLWTTPAGDPRQQISRSVIERCGVPFEMLPHGEIERRFPQIRFDSERIGMFEPDSGVLLARRAVQAVVREFIALGGSYVDRVVEKPDASARVWVFACGPWLPALFPELLGHRIHVTRQEVFFFGPQSGDTRFDPPRMPVWLEYTDPRRAYTIPNLEGRGFKLAFDRHGPAFDPENGSRLVPAESVGAARSFLAERFPALERAPLLETRVCQYENTANGDFLIDRHPDIDNLWLVGGGSGHGFKHGPAVGEHVAKLIAGEASVEPRFALTP